MVAAVAARPFRQIAVVVISGAAALGLRVWLERRQDPALTTVPVEIPAYTRLMALSYDALAADLLWVQYLQRVPMRPADQALGRALGTQMQAVVELDPWFRSAYLHGSVLLSVLGNQPCAALDIVERGEQRFPEDWKIAFQAGYNCFADLSDFACAARHMRRAAALPHAPPWLPGLVSRLLADSSQLDAAIEYLVLELKRTEDPRLRARFEDRLREAVLTRDLQVLDAALRAYRLQTGRVPLSFEEVVNEEILAEAPGADPFGGTYRIDANGRAQTSTVDRLLRTIKRDSVFVGDVRENLMPQRVSGRLGGWVRRPAFAPDPLDAVEARAGLVTAGLAGLETVSPWLDERNPDALSNVRTFQARALLRLELDALREAQVEILQERRGARPTAAEIAERAGVPGTDAFGTAWRFDESGVISPASSRQPLVAVRGGTDNLRTAARGSSSACLR